MPRPKKSPTLIDLPVEVLLLIFDYFTFREKLLLSNVNKKFRNVIVQNFRLNLYSFCKIVLRDYNFCCISVNGIETYNMTFTLRFLRLFGFHIKKFCLNSLECDRKLLHIIFRYVNKYCVNVSHMYFMHLNDTLGLSLRNPMKNVKHLWFKFCTISRKLCNINRFFPSVEYLLFYGPNYIKDTSKIEAIHKSLIVFHISENNFDSNFELIGRINPKILNMRKNNSDLNVELITMLNPEVMILSESGAKDMIDKIYYEQI